MPDRLNLRYHHPSEFCTVIRRCCCPIRFGSLQAVLCRLRWTRPNLGPVKKSIFAFVTHAVISIDRLTLLKVLLDWLSLASRTFL